MTYMLNPTVAMPSAKPAAENAKPMGASNGPSFWQKLYNAMIESRRRSAIRELRARHYLVNEAELVLGGFPQTTLNRDAALPFNR